MAFCSRRSRTALVDALRWTLVASLSLQQPPLPKVSAESTQDLAEYE